MKSTIIILITIVCTVLLSCSSTNNKEVPQTTAVRMVMDITDTMTIKPDSIAILNLFNLNNYRDNGAQFNFTTITDKQLNPTEEVILPQNLSTQTPTGDIHFRDKAIVQFHTQVLSILRNQSEAFKSPLANTECYKTICKELVNLQETKADKKMLIVGGDLLENNQALNIYALDVNDVSFKTRIYNYLINSKLLPDRLDNIKVILMYNPTNRKKDIQYALVAEVYKNVLKSRGAIVTILATNKITM